MEATLEVAAQEHWAGCYEDSWDSLTRHFEEKEEVQQLVLDRFELGQV